MSRAVLVALLLISWAPISGPGQLVAYVGPLGLLLAGALLDAVRLSPLDLAVLLLIGVLAVASAFVGPETSLLNPAVGVLTYSSAFLLAARFRPAEAGPSLVRTFFAATAWLSIGQAILGSLQLVLAQGSLVFVHASMGDTVVGTLLTNSHLFAVKMLFQGLVLALGWRFASTAGWTSPSPRLLVAGLVASLFGAMLASAMLATAAFGAAVGTWLVLDRFAAALARLAQRKEGPGLQSFRIVFATAVLLALLGAGFASTQSRNVEIIGSALEGLVRGDFELPKVASLRLGIEEVLLHDGKTTAIGTGLGRYSSRAAMILSGGYLKSQPGWMPVSRSEWTTNHIYSRWRATTWGDFLGSIMGMPTSSVQAVVVELGLLGTAAILLYAVMILVRAERRRARIPADHEVSPLLRAVAPLLLALVAICFTDVWLEYASFTTFVYAAIALGLSNGPARAPEAVSEPSPLSG